MLRADPNTESAALKAILKAIKGHPAVAWCERMNSGAARIGSRYVKFGFKGCPTCWVNSRTVGYWASK
jgi:hypothetical protein